MFLESKMKQSQRDEWKQKGFLKGSLVILCGSLDVSHAV